MNLQLAVLYDGDSLKWLKESLLKLHMWKEKNYNCKDIDDMRICQNLIMWIIF